MERIRGHATSHGQTLLFVPGQLPGVRKHSVSVHLSGRYSRWRGDTMRRSRKGIGMGESVPVAREMSFSFLTCVSNRKVLDANLLASPCLAPGGRHEMIAVTHCPSAADGLNLGLERAQYDWTICIHQDVYLPEGWDRLLSAQLDEAERRFGPIGVAGVYGVGDVIAPGNLTQPLGAQGIGWVVDRGRELRDGPALPARVATLDELLLVVRRNAGLRFDPALGFHFYGADLCLQARERGLAVVAIGALCHHNSRNVGLPKEFYQSAAVFARKWDDQLPVATPLRDHRPHERGRTFWATRSRGRDRWLMFAAGYERQTFSSVRLRGRGHQVCNLRYPFHVAAMYRRIWNRSERS